jgi:transposase
MYIDVVPNRKSPPAILLRESYREGKKVKKRTIANLSKAPAFVIDAIKISLNGCVTTPHINREFSVSSGLVYGVVDVLNQFIKKSGLRSALGDSRQAKLVQFLICARIAHQGSRLSAVRWAKNHAIDDVLGLKDFDENDLYGALDWLAQRQNEVEDSLYRIHLKEHKKSLALVLYDVTSSYFEGEENELAKYGYNRDGKKGKKQIVIGLLTAADGEPLAVEVFEGNTSDPTTVESQIQKLVERFKVEDVIFVGDRGMIKAKGKEALASVSFRYITALTDAQVKKLIFKKIIQPGLFDEKLSDVEFNGKRLVLCRVEETMRKEQHRREHKIETLRQKIAERNQFVANSKRANLVAGLANIQAWAKSHKLLSFIMLTADNNAIEMTIDENAKADDALLDGCYVLETDVKNTILNTEEIQQRYMDLQKVERDFRSMKTGLLEVRPIFLRNGMRTKAHVFISMLALKVTRKIQKKLVEKFGTTNDDRMTDTLCDGLHSLARICLQTYRLGEVEFKGLPKPDAHQQSILDALQITLTAPIMAAVIL